MAVFCDRLVALVADDEDVGGRFDDVVGDGLELVDFEHPCGSRAAIPPDL